jgi:hypothetical protein
MAEEQTTHAWLCVVSASAERWRADDMRVAWRLYGASVHVRLSVNASRIACIGIGQAIRSVF